MKKFTCVGLSMVLALGLLAGCGGNLHRRLHLHGVRDRRAGRAVQG